MPALINFFKTAVSKRKDPVAPPATFASTSASASSATPQASSADNRNNGNNNNSKLVSQSNGNTPVPVKRVSRFAPLASTAVQINNSSESFHSILMKLNQKATERKEEGGSSQSMDMDMDIDAQYGSYDQPPMPPRGIVPPPPLPPSMSSHSSQFQPPPQYY